jgi:hypothetical protein
LPLPDVDVTAEIYDGDTNLPIQGAKAVLAWMGPSGQTGISTTGADGKARFTGSGIPRNRARYAVAAEAPGYTRAIVECRITPKYSGTTYQYDILRPCKLYIYKRTP